MMRAPSKVGPYCSQHCRGLDIRVDPIEYFWAHVNKTETCWLWTGERNGPNGYGQIPRSFRRRGAFGVEIKAHRVAWVLTNGPIQNGVLTLHKCDNPPCVRPDHLFLGTHRDNSEDRDRKGRANTAIGEDSGGCILTAADVITIRKRYAARDITLEKLAIEFDTTLGNVSHIVRGDTWRHLLKVAPAVIIGARRGKESGSAKLTESAVVAIRMRYAAGGVTQEDLARRFGVGHTAIYKIVNGHSWTSVV